MLLVLLITLFSNNINTKAQAPITDIDSSYAKVEITTLIEQNIITGYKDNTFKPRNSISRVEFAAMLARGLDLTEDVVAAAHFKDVPVWEKGYVGALVNEGYVN